ncbi:hypothetical protein [Fluviispira vulneris]|uniref:hypothetical protein n=1 Tax=Fluviispira vulneris TaxID=2763012 RepID=UPI001C940285|nr:hypothetical protein [Fluviispira vulneris]
MNFINEGIKMSIFYISVMAHYNYKDTLEFYFDNEEIAGKYIMDIITRLKKEHDDINVKKYDIEKSCHVYNGKSINHVYKIHELKKFEA